MTPKQKVLKKNPFAYATTTQGGITTVFPYPTHGYSNAIATSDRTPADAWAKAARSIYAR